MLREYRYSLLLADGILAPEVSADPHFVGEETRAVHNLVASILTAETAFLAVAMRLLISSELQKRERRGNTCPISHVFVPTVADCIFKTGKGSVDPAVF